MKLGRLKEYNVTNIFLGKLRRKRGRDTSSRPLFSFLKSFIRGKQLISTLVSIYFGSP